MQIKYYSSQVLTQEAALTEEQAVHSEFYNKLYSENEVAIKSEFYSNGILIKVVYFNTDPQTFDKASHMRQYKEVEFEILNTFRENQLYCQYRYYFDSGGALESYWLLKGEKEWQWQEEIMFSSNDEKQEIIKSHYDEEGNQVKEVHYHGDGSFWYELDID